MCRRVHDCSTALAAIVEARLFYMNLDTPADPHNTYSLFNRIGLHCDVVDIKHSGIDIGLESLADNAA